MTKNINVKNGTLQTSKGNQIENLLGPKKRQTESKTEMMTQGYFTLVINSNFGRFELG